MSVRDNEREWGPSWGDVKQHLEELSRAHNRSVKVNIDVIKPRSGPSLLYVSVTTYTLDRNGDMLPNTARGHQWPSDGWKTMPAMILALIFKLDGLLTDYERAAEQQAEF